MLGEVTVEVEVTVRLDDMVLDDACTLVRLVEICEAVVVVS